MCPQAAAAGREHIAHAVFFVAVEQLAAAAERAGRKSETVHALAILHVLRLKPQLDEIALAYAITIHKSQGSEFPAVVIPLAMQQYMLLQRNLVYTGITRGKKLVVLIGQRKALAMAAEPSACTPMMRGTRANQPS